MPNLARFTRFEQWAIANPSLLLHDAGVLNAGDLSAAIDRGSRNKVNETLSDALKTWDAKLTTQAMMRTPGDDAIPLDLDVRCCEGHRGERSATASINGHCYAYPAEGFGTLSADDEKALAASLAETSALLLPVGLPHEIEVYFSWRIEDFDVLKAWLPNGLKESQDPDAIAQHCRQNNYSEYEYYEDVACLAQDYAARNTPMPNWVKDMEDDPGSDTPQAAVRRLQGLLPSVRDPYATALISFVVRSMTAFASHFPTKPVWQEYQSNRIAVEQQPDDYQPLCHAFLLYWDQSEYWWSVGEAMHEMMMQGDEMPMWVTDIESPKSRDTFRLGAEAAFRGAAIYQALVDFSERRKAIPVGEETIADSLD